MCFAWIKKIGWLLGVALSISVQGQSLKKIEIKNTNATLMGYSPDAAHFIVIRNTRVQLYNAGTDTRITEFAGPNHTLPINAMAFNKDGSLLVTGGEDKVLKIWSLPAGNVIASITRHSLPVTELAFVNNDQYIACLLQDGTVRVFNHKTGAEVYMKHDFKKPQTLAVSTDGKYWSLGGAEPYVTIYESATGNVFKKLEGLTGWTRALAFSPDGKWLARGGNSKKITLWNLSDYTTKELEHTGWVNDLEFSGDSRQLSACLDKNVIAFYNITTGLPSLRLDRLELPAKTISMHPNGQEVAGLEDYSGNVVVWDIRSLNIAPTLQFKDKRDNLSPQVLVSNPSNIIDNRVMVYQDRIDLRGIVTDESGVRSLKINGIETPVRQNGNFLINMELAIGDNFITMEVADVNGNIALKKFVIVRKNMDGETYVAAKAKNYLFVVGINDYSQWPKLNNAVRDANDLVNVLLSKYEFQFENVTVLKNDQASRANIYNGLRELVEKITPNDNLMIYFSGHGYFDKVLNEGYWIPIEASTRSAADYISNTDILKILGSINSQHTFLVSDACFSGALFADSRRGYAENVEKFKSRWGLASGRLETVSDGGNGGNSPFANRLLQFLKENQKDAFPVSELIQYVKTHVADESDQTPIGNPLRNLGDEGGEFVFRLRKD